MSVQTKDLGSSGWYSGGGQAKVEGLGDKGHGIHLGLGVRIKVGVTERSC